MLDYDNEILRDNKDIMQHCYRTRQTTLNPIVDWTDDDVWEFLKYYGCEGNPLYHCGYGRIGCIGCPLGGYVHMKRGLNHYPKYKQMYIHAFERMIKVREEKEKPTEWKSGEEVLNWWINVDTSQMTFEGFDVTEL